MTCPEFSSPQKGEAVFVASHRIETAEALRLSIAFNRARIEHARKHLPPTLPRCVLFYDLRGQHYSADSPADIQHALGSICEVRFMIK
jgi:hypothetical protein